MVSRRAILIGLVMCIIIGIGEAFFYIGAGVAPLAADYSTGWAIFLFFFLVFGINLILKKVSRVYIKPAELITVYIMMLVGCAIPSWGLTMKLIGILAGITYYGNPVNNWVKTISPYLPRYLFPQDKQAISYFYEGLPKGEKLPWSVWIGPLSHWFLFILVFFFMNICIIVMLRKQWVERERLTYPLVELPKVMVKDTTSFYESKLMWIGFLVPFILFSLSFIHLIFPLFPLNLRSIQYRNIPIFSRAGNLGWGIYLEVIGLAFLMPLDVSLSVWLFAFLFTMENGFLNRVGYFTGSTPLFAEPAHPVVAYQSFGALLVLSISCLYYGRDHLKRIFLKAIGKGDIDEEDEILPSGVLWWGFSLSFIFVVWYLKKIGLGLLPSIFFVIVTILIFLGLTRIIAQTGLAYHKSPLSPQDPTIYFLGSKFINRSGFITLGLTWPFATDLRTIMMASTANGLKLATEFKINSRRLFLAIFLAIVITLITSFWSTLYFSYKYGAINCHHDWLLCGNPQYCWKWVNNLIKYPPKFGKTEFGFTILGGVIMAFLIFVKSRFLWWPISPIGFTLGIPHPVFYTWTSVFIAWLIKFLIMKYGGVKTYQQVKKFFLGLILGSFVTTGILNLIGALIKQQGVWFIYG